MLHLSCTLISCGISDTTPTPNRIWTLCPDNCPDAYAKGKMSGYLDTLCTHLNNLVCFPGDVGEELQDSTIFSCARSRCCRASWSCGLSAMALSKTRMASRYFPRYIRAIPLLYHASANPGSMSAAWANELWVNLTQSLKLK